MKAYEFWTDAGDQDDIEADTLEDAAYAASMEITVRQWNDGAWGTVRDPQTGGQMDVPSRAAT
jgi:hypothetical protein